MAEPGQVEGGAAKRWFWSDWGLVARLMVAVGIAVVAGGLMQSALLVVERNDKLVKFFKYCIETSSRFMLEVKFKVAIGVIIPNDNPEISSFFKAVF